MGAQGQPMDVSNPGEIHLTRIFAVLLLVGMAAAWPHILAAQSPEQADDMVRVGDRWSFDSKDEITGFPKDTFTRVVTEVSPKEIVVSVTFRGKSGSSLVVYDHDWNRLENSAWKYKSNDGQGIRPPLSVGKEWRYEFEARNSQTGAASKTSGTSKILAQEMVTTPAGTFATFKIETRKREVSGADPSKSWEYENVGWYAPQINYWVRRTFLTKIQKRTSSNESEELISFDRKL